MDPVATLRRVAFLLERENADTYRVKAFRGAAAAPWLPLGTRRSGGGSMPGPSPSCRGWGQKTAAVATQAVTAGEPTYLAELEALPCPGDRLGVEARALLDAQRGDCHTHSDWSDGGSPPLEMALACVELGHEWTVLTDHSPRLTVARGLTRERLARQLDLVEQINSELAPFRYLTGIEVDINEDGTLDQDDDLLARLDVVVASVHSKLRAPSVAMTPRMVRAITNPHVDVLGHCTGAASRRISRGRSRSSRSRLSSRRAGSSAWPWRSTVVPERLDPPRRILRMAVEADLLLAIDTDAHAPGQLDWQANGAERAVQCDVDASRVVTTWTAAELLAWTGQRGR